MLFAHWLFVAQHKRNVTVDIRSPFHLLWSFSGIMQVLLGAQQISIGMPSVKADCADTLDRDLLLPECQANEVHRGIGLDLCQEQVSMTIRGLHCVCAKKSQMNPVSHCFILTWKAQISLF